MSKPYAGSSVALDFAAKASPEATTMNTNTPAIAHSRRIIIAYSSKNLHNWF
jgi:hypothetical protein